MNVTVNISYREFMRLNFFLAYRKRGGIITVLVGLLFLLSSALHFVGITLIDIPIQFQLLLGLMITFLLPLTIYKNYRKSYYSNHLLQENINYEFAKDRLKLSGAAFSSEVEWNKIFKIVELKSGFLIYTSVRSSNLIPKKDMSAEDINRLRDFFKNLDDVKIKKLK